MYFQLNPISIGYDPAVLCVRICSRNKKANLDIAGVSPGKGKGSG